MAREPINEEWLFKRIGDRLKILRERAGINRFSASERSGIGKTAYYALEAGRSNFQLSTLVKALNALGADIQEVFCPDDQFLSGEPHVAGEAAAQLQREINDAVLKTATLSNNVADLRVTTDRLRALSGSLGAQPSSDDPSTKGRKSGFHR